MEETVMHLMKRGAITCREDCTVREVAQIMVVNRIGYCVVVNEKHEVVGIISPRSILKAYGMDLIPRRRKRYSSLTRLPSLPALPFRKQSRS